jgi:hypothetical protein
MAKKSIIVRDGLFEGLPYSIAAQIGEASKLSEEPEYTDCWPWKGMTGGGEYGRAKTSTSKDTLVHRIVYEWKNGPIPRNRMVLHLCNYPLCCNPRHLEVGTHKENMQHMAACKRSSDVSGVKNPKSIVKPDQVLEVRNAYAVGETVKSISLRMKLEPGTVAALVLRDRNDSSTFKFWSDVGGPMRRDEAKRKPHDKFGLKAESIRLAYQKGSTVNELAQEWSASPAQIGNILRGLSHADRPGPIFSSPLRWGSRPRGSGKRLATNARDIRFSYEKLGTVQELAERYGVSPKSISNTLLGHTRANEGGPIASRPLRYSDRTIRPIREKPKFVVRTQHLSTSGRFTGLPHSVIRKIGEPTNRDGAMGYKNCWPWTGHKKSGYGGGRKLAHVLLYEWANGPVSPGLVVMHLCNQRDCCNPDHLEAGTRSENMQYMAASGRASRLTGTSNPGSRFTPAHVLETRTRFASGATLSDIASPMGLAYKDIDHLVSYDSEKGRYRYWQEVGGPVRPAKIRRRHQKSR